MSRRAGIQENNGVSFWHSPPRHSTNLEWPLLYTHSWLTSVHLTKGHDGLVPRPPPRFYLTAMEKSVRNLSILLHGCKKKSGQRPGNKARGMTHPCSQPRVVHTCAPMFNPFLIAAKSLKKQKSLYKVLALILNIHINSYGLTDTIQAHTGSIGCILLNEQTKNTSTL